MGGPFFKHQPLDYGVVDQLRSVLTHPDFGENMDLIDDMLDLHADPCSPMADRLQEYVEQTGFYLRVYQLNSLLAGWVGVQLEHSPERALEEVNQWFLQHAEAAGFLPAPRARTQDDLMASV